MSEYTEKAEKFLKEHDISFSAVMKGDKCPLWCKGDHIHGERYFITLKRKGTKQRYSLSFWNSLNDMQTGKKPIAYDVLAAIQKYDPQSLEEFCQEYGYYTDSIEANKVYKAVVKEWQSVAKFFSLSELEELREID